MRLRYLCSCLLLAALLIFYCTGSGFIPAEFTYLPAPRITPTGSVPKRSDGTTIRYTPNYPLHFIGDSRTVGMQQSLPSDTPNLSYASFTAKVGQGYSWFSGRSDLTSSAPRILLLNLGVNDLTNVSAYQALYETYANTCWKDCPIYIISVNPCCAPCTSVTNTRIEAFNTSMETWVEAYNTSLPDTENAPASTRALPIHYIDTYHFLLETGFSSSDGLHYNAATYQKLYDFILDQIEEPIGDGSGIYTVSS